jgi:hypothetical protein
MARATINAAAESAVMNRIMANTFTARADKIAGRRPI